MRSDPDVHSTSQKGCLVRLPRFFLDSLHLERRSESRVTVGPRLWRLRVQMCRWAELGVIQTRPDAHVNLSDATLTHPLEHNRLLSASRRPTRHQRITPCALGGNHAVLDGFCRATIKLIDNQQVHTEAVTSRWRCSSNKPASAVLHRHRLATIRVDHLRIKLSLKNRSETVEQLTRQVQTMSSCKHRLRFATFNRHVKKPAEKKNTQSV